MADCCSPPGRNSNHPGKHGCPTNNQEYFEVSLRTISHHIKEPWAWTPTAARYFFCEDPECDVVYFGDDGSTIVKSQLRTLIGVKEKADDSPICYCFGVRKAEARLVSATRNFVMAQTKAGMCTCETSNPSGRCCLKDFPKAGE